MKTAAEIAAHRANTRALRADSLTLMSFSVIVVGGVCLLQILWIPTGGNAPAGAWIASVLLLAGGILARVLSKRLAILASWVLVGAVLGSLAYWMFALRSLTVAYLFTVPIVIAGVLLGQGGLFLISSLAGLLSLNYVTGHLGLPLRSTDALLPLGVNIATTLTCWLSSRSLYMALAWAWQGFERARRDERLARENEAELRQTLKSLDQTTYQLERANVMLSFARDQADEGRRLKQQFAQTISHELRTPLHLIVAFAELMTQSPEYYGRRLPAAYARDLAIIYRNASHLRNLVNDVLDLARIDAAQLGLSLEEVDPATLVQEAVDTVRSLVAARALRLTVCAEPNLPHLWVDPTRIRQVLFNLLNNAARFTDHGVIQVSARRQGDEVIFAVADTGVGIPAEDMPRMFQEFQQVEGGTRRPHGGAGLGLAISKRFVELHCGRIWAESEVSRGSTFYFGLPVAHHELAAGAAVHPSGMVHTAMSDPNRDRILLAITRSEAAAMLLTRYVHGWRTVVVPNLEQARQTAMQLLPQAVVVDTASGALAGLGASELARAWGLRRTPVIACPLSGEDTPRQRLAVDGYLAKPLTRQGVLDVLRRFGQDVARVLVVDDDPDSARLLSRILEGPPHRYHVATVRGGHEGLDLIRFDRPDLILLDTVLSDMPGAELLERLRADPALRSLRAVIMSGQSEIDTVEALAGDMLIGRANGLVVGEVVRWIQHVLDTSGGQADDRA